MGDETYYDTSYYDYPSDTTYDPSSYDYTPGTGAYSVGGGDWQGISAPGYDNTYQQPTQYLDAGAYDAMRGAAPSSRTSGYTGYDSYSSPSSAWGYDQPQTPMYTPPGYNRPTGGGNSGARAVAGQTPQMIALGSPEHTLYDRYKSLLTNPDFSNDPTYKFLYDQGLQAMQRSQAAKGMMLSGNSMLDALNYGAGTASKYMQQLLPQYHAGAQEELARFLGPAGLLPRYAASNNATISQAGQDVAAADLLPAYQARLSSGWGTPGPGFGTGGLNYASTLPALAGGGAYPQYSYSASSTYDPTADMDAYLSMLYSQ